MPPARESKDVTISPSCLKGDGGGFGQRRFWGKAVAASSVSRAAESNSRDVWRIGSTFVFLVKDGLTTDESARVGHLARGWQTGGETVFGLLRSIHQVYV